MREVIVVVSLLLCGGGGGGGDDDDPTEITQNGKTIERHTSSCVPIGLLIFFSGKRKMRLVWLLPLTPFSEKFSFEKAAADDDDLTIVVFSWLNNEELMKARARDYGTTAVIESPLIIIPLPLGNRPI